jgi:hypothetical protein
MSIFVQPEAGVMSPTSSFGPSSALVIDSPLAELSPVSTEVIEVWVADALIELLAESLSLLLASVGLVLPLSVSSNSKHNPSMQVRPGSHAPPAVHMHWRLPTKQSA